MNTRAQCRSTQCWLGVVALSAIGGFLTAAVLCAALSLVLLLLQAVLLPTGIL